ncbi:MAG: sulfatase-like hydrolase/transferase, partial [Candidatus Hydrogenedentes bacterium]|nr:sulfatase-like hydrolase/transferase [Candidatus Hydrogenedentota bacterium]
ELRFDDALAGRMIRSLKSAKMWENTLFILVADHGESLGENGLLSHQFGLYEAMARIPLLIHYPPAFPEGSIERHPVQIQDIFPTVLDVAGLGAERFPHQGRSLLPGQPSADREIFLEYYLHPGFRNGERDARWKDPHVQHFNRRLNALRKGPHKLIAGSDASIELYDVANDPWETRNLADNMEFTGIRESLLANLADRVERPGKDTAAPHAPEHVPTERDVLESLGYV